MYIVSSTRVGSDEVDSSSLGAKTSPVNVNNIQGELVL